MITHASLKLLRLFCCLLLVEAIFAGSASAVDTTWISDLSDNWNVASNWNNGEPVDNTFDVFIDEGDASVTVFLNVTRSIGNLTLGSDDTLEMNNNQDLTIFGSTITNAGTLFQNSTFNNTDVRINGDVTVTGNGTWSMSDENANRVFGNATGTEKLTNDTGHTIEGAGTFSGLGELINKGTINATKTSNPLLIQSTAAVTNTGTLRASSGGTLTLASAVTNTGGIIEAREGSIVALSGLGAQIIGGTLSTQGDGVIRVAAGTPTLDSVTLNGRLRLPNDQDAIFKGTITNSASTIEQMSTFNNTDVRISGDVTVTGNGTWSMSDENANRVFGDVTGTEVLTNDTGHTIEGAGTFSGLGELINKGTINATKTNNPLLIQSTAAVTNTGTLRASSGGTLTLASAVTNTGGIIEAREGSIVALSGLGAQIIGGTLSTQGDGVIRVAAGTPTLDSVTLNGRLRLPNDQDAIFKGTITNSASTIEQMSTFNLTDVRISGDVTVTGNGTWSMSDENANRVFGDATGTEKLTNDTGHTIEGAGTFSGLGELINKGTINATKTNNPLLIQSTAPVTNSGTLKASGGGTLRLASQLTNNGGIIEAEDASIVEIASSGAVMDGVTFQTSGSGVVLLAGGGQPTLKDVTINGLVRLPNNQDAKFVGTITNNTNTFEQVSTFNNTDVRISGDVTVTGNGIWSMSDENANRVFGDVTATEVLTNDTGHTIEGAGTFSGLGELINKGTINASRTGNPLLIESSAPVNNSGTLKASGGGTLRLASQLTNSGGLIEAEDASIVEIASSGAVMDGVTFQTSGSGVVLLAGGGQPTLKDVTINGLVRLPNNQDAKFEGTITNNTNTFEQVSTFNNTDVRISGDVTVTGNGTWSMSDENANRVFGDVTATEVLTNDSGHTIEGAGTFSGLGELINKGTINASRTGNPLLIESSAPVNNSGTLKASGGGTLRLASQLTNNGGIIEAEDASIVEIASSGAVMDGVTFQTSGSGVVLLAGGGQPTLKDVTINGLVRLPNNQDAKFVGTITNNTNTFEQVSTFNNTDVRISGDVTVTGNGIWSMSDENANRVFGDVTATEVLTNDSGHTIEGAGTFSGLGELINKGTINASRTGNPLLIESSAPVNNSGTLKASGGGTLRLASQLTNNGGIIEAEDASIVEIASSGAVMDGVTFQTSGSGVVLLAGGGQPTLKDVTINGLVRLPNNQDAKFVGTITNNTNTFEQVSTFNNTDVRISGDVTVTGNGTWSMSDENANRVFGDVTATEVLTNDSGHTIEGAGTFSSIGLINRGLILANQSNNPLLMSPSDLDLDGNGADILNQEGGVMRASGAGGLQLGGGHLVNRSGGDIIVESTVSVTSAGLLENRPGGTILGNGILNVSAGNFTNGGTVSPGFSPAILTVVGDYPQTASGELVIELTGTELGTEYDQLAVNGDVMLDGSLLVDLLFAAAFENSFTVIEAGFDAGNNVTGEFSNAPRANPKLVIPEGTFDVLYNPQQVILTHFVPIPEPSTLVLAALGLVALLAIRPNLARTK